jgi:hypothetical protein
LGQRGKDFSFGLEDSLVLKLSYRRRTCGLRVAARESIHIRFTAMHAPPSEKNGHACRHRIPGEGGNNQSLEMCYVEFISMNSKKKNPSTA